jgi:predicted methyltransferase/ribosomal protein S18 acetylase RimI-like enzyme
MQSDEYVKPSSLLGVISKRAKVEEGEEAVREILREIFRNQRISTKELASYVRLPLPVTAAIRRELEKEGLLARNGGASLTERGRKFIEEELQFAYTQKFSCQTCQGLNVQIPDKLQPSLERLSQILFKRPKPLTWLDQAHATPRTSLMRALLMLERGDIEGRKIIFLGDDDLTSVAVSFLRAARKITVVDVDNRILNFVDTVSDKENLKITCVNHDLRRPLPDYLRDEYDVVFTDPPYTIAGLTLFVSRGISALVQRKGASIYLAFAHQPPEKMLDVHKSLNAMGLEIVELIPRFNVYEGAEMFANTTLLAHLITTGRTEPLTTSVFDGKLYTGEMTESVRTYRCRCGEQIKVGATATVRTIEELKTQGCPKCGSEKGFKLIERRKLKESIGEKLTTRDFKWSDFPRILEFEREIAKKSFPTAPILDEQYHRQKLRRTIKSDPSSLKVAVLNGEVVGWLWLKKEKDRVTQERFGYIKSIIVKPKYRHQRIGTRLMMLAERYFSRKHIDRIDLIVSNANYEAAMFFERVGFSKEHSTMRKRLDGEGEATN